MLTLEEKTFMARALKSLERIATSLETIAKAMEDKK